MTNRPQKSKSKHPADMEISPDFTVADWEKLKLKPDSPQESWGKAIEIFEARIQRRFIEPVDVLIEHQKDQKHTFGFAILAIEFIVMETLQGFRCGAEDHIGMSGELIAKFLREWPLFQKCTNGEDTEIRAEKLYKAYRCSLLHSGSTDGDMRVGISGPAFNFKEDECIKLNRTTLHQGLKCEFTNYVQDLRNSKNKNLRESFITKMNYICGVNNC